MQVMSFPLVHENHRHSGVFIGQHTSINSAQANRPAGVGIEFLFRLGVWVRGMHEIIAKFWDSTRHMADGLVERLPAFAVCAMVFLVFYVSSNFVARMMRRAVSRRRANLGLVLERLSGGAMILLGLLVALSIVAPSFQTVD